MLSYEAIIWVGQRLVLPILTGLGSILIWWWLEWLWRRPIGPKGKTKESRSGVSEEDSAALQDQTGRHPERPWLRGIHLAIFLFGFSVVGGYIIYEELDDYSPVVVFPRQEQGVGSRFDVRGHMSVSWFRPYVYVFTRSLQSREGGWVVSYRTVAGADGWFTADIKVPSHVPLGGRLSLYVHRSSNPELYSVETVVKFLPMSTKKGGLSNEVIVHTIHEE